MFLMVSRPLVSTPAIKGSASETNLVITRLGSDDPADGVTLGGFGDLDGLGVTSSTLGGTVTKGSEASTPGSTEGATDAMALAVRDGGGAEGPIVGVVVV